jgi:uncharacterized membrane protein
MTRWRLRRTFPQTALQAITDSIRDSERQHGGEIRVAIEADLSLRALLSAQTPRERAREVFSLLGVWDTQDRNGVLIYLCLADHDVEIVADRGLCPQVSDAQWAEVCIQLERDCAAGHHAQGVCTAVYTVGELIGERYPVADRNEQTDRPVLL